MKKLSEQLFEMSQKAAAFEKSAAERNEENRKEYEADIAAARKSEQEAQAAFAAKLDGVHDSVSAHWREVQKSFNNQVAAARARAAADKTALDVDTAQMAADIDEAYAQVASEFANVAAAEANAAMVDAARSRTYAKSLENPTPAR
jgi:hypothetical protein